MTKDDVRAVMRRAKAFDNRFPDFSDERLDAWHAMLGDSCWPDEALDGVKAHYSRSNAFPLMPGDVLSFCQAQPPWSSEAHAAEFLRKWCMYPYSGMIGRQSGIQEPVFAIPESVGRHGEKNYLIERLRAWVDLRERELVAGVLELKMPLP